MNISGIHSEVELNKAYIEPGMKIWYTDACNCDRFVVEEVYDDEVILLDDSGDRVLEFFSTMQYGWKLGDAAREIIEEKKNAAKKK